MPTPTTTQSYGAIRWTRPPTPRKEELPLLSWEEMKAKFPDRRRCRCKVKPCVHYPAEDTRETHNDGGECGSDML